MTFDLRAHLDQHLGQIGHLWLLGGVFQHRLAIGQRGSHEEVFGAGDGDHVGGDARALEPRLASRQLGHHVTVFHHDFGAHGLQALDVLIHRAGADRAAAGQRHLGATEARQQRAQHQHRRTHRLDQVIRRDRIDGFGSVQGEPSAFAMHLGMHAHVLQQLAHGGHVAQTRHVAQHHRLVGQQGGAKLGQGGILRARHGDFTTEAAAAADTQLVHGADSALGGPFGRGMGFHRQGMHLVGLDALTQGGIHQLVPLDQPFAFKNRRHDHRRPVAAIARNFDVVARQPLCNENLELVSSHGSLRSMSDFVAGLEQVQCQATHPQKRRGDDTQAQPG